MNPISNRDPGDETDYKNDGLCGFCHMDVPRPMSHLCAGCEAELQVVDSSPPNERPVSPFSPRT